MGNFPLNHYPKLLDPITLNTKIRIQYKFEKLRSFLGSKQARFFLFAVLLSPKLFFTIVLYQFILASKNYDTSKFEFFYTLFTLIMFFVAVISQYILEYCFPMSKLRHRFTQIFFMMIYIFSNSQNTTNTQLVPY